MSMFFSFRVAALQPRLTTMLRVQLSAIANIAKSHIFDQRLSISEDIVELRQMLDDVGDGDLEEIQKILEQTTVLYDQVRLPSDCFSTSFGALQPLWKHFPICVRMQISRGVVVPSQSDSWTMTEPAEGESDFFDDDDEDTKQDSEWQAEMTAIQVCSDSCVVLPRQCMSSGSSWSIRLLQNTHQSELETIRHHYEHQMKVLRERIEHEEARRRKLQEELVQITVSDMGISYLTCQFLNPPLFQTRNDQSLTTVKASFEDVLEEQRTGFQEEMEQLRKEHQRELDEEKAATRSVTTLRQRLGFRSELSVLSGWRWRPFDVHMKKSSSRLRWRRSTVRRIVTLPDRSEFLVYWVFFRSL